MPLFRYKPAIPPCKICGDGFEQRQSAKEPPLRECPTCGMDVVRQPPSGVNIPRATRKRSVNEAKSAGFTVLKKTSDGSFERQ